MGGKAIINGGALEFGAASSTKTSFASGARGQLKLDDAPHFTGNVSGLAPGDSIDLADINLATLQPLTYTPNIGNTGGTLTVSDGTNTAHIALLGQFIAAGFQQAADNGTGTIITYAPPAAASLNEAMLTTPHHT
jgi:hypothetical protein